MATKAKSVEIKEFDIKLPVMVDDYMYPQFTLGLRPVPTIDRDLDLLLLTS